MHSQYPQPSSPHCADRQPMRLTRSWLSPHFHHLTLKLTTKHWGAFSMPRPLGYMYLAAWWRGVSHLIRWGWSSNAVDVRPNRTIWAKWLGCPTWRRCSLSTINWGTGCHTLPADTYPPFDAYPLNALANRPFCTICSKIAYLENEQVNYTMRFLPLPTVCAPLTLIQSFACFDRHARVPHFLIGS